MTTYIKVTKDLKITRQKLENPFSSNSYHKRLLKSKAIDLENNYTIIDFDNGYSQIKPIDKNKLVK